MSQSVNKVVELFPNEAPVALPRCQVLRMDRHRQQETLMNPEIVFEGDYKPLWGEIFRGLFVDALTCMRARLMARRGARHV